MFDLFFFDVSSLLLGSGRAARGPGAVGGGQQHGEEQQHGHQQVRGIDGHQQPALSLALRTRVRILRELMEEDVGQDGEQRGGNMRGVHNGRGPDPPTAPWKASSTFQR